MFKYLDWWLVISFLHNNSKEPEKPSFVPHYWLYRISIILVWWLSSGFLRRNYFWNTSSFQINYYQLSQYYYNSAKYICLHFSSDRLFWKLINCYEVSHKLFEKIIIWYFAARSSIALLLIWRIWLAACTASRPIIVEIRAVHAGAMKSQIKSQIFRISADNIILGVYYSS